MALQATITFNATHLTSSNPDLKPSAEDLATLKEMLAPTDLNPIFQIPLVRKLDWAIDSELPTPGTPISRHLIDMFKRFIAAVENTLKVDGLLNTGFIHLGDTEEPNDPLLDPRAHPLTVISAGLPRRPQSGVPIISSVNTAYQPCTIEIDPALAPRGEYGLTILPVLNVHADSEFARHSTDFTCLVGVNDFFADTSTATTYRSFYTSRNPKSYGTERSPVCPLVFSASFDHLRYPSGNPDVADKYRNALRELCQTHDLDTRRTSRLVTDIDQSHVMRHLMQ